ncbi:dihydrofolate reductase family protein [Elioraea rosea]|uniref:dihydrofolate reductase family protein n=1 Tax=Elioraea rosea TaxID=2492390 RepID=UPI0011846101|nr:dihydrofolate reductase family protein [Elioraea rosea]
MSRPEVIASLATSADGFVAEAGGGFDFLLPYDPSALGFDAFLAGIDTVLMGRTTFEHVLAMGPWPYGGKRGVIVTSREAALPEGVIAIPPEPAALAPALASLGARRVWNVGGPRTLAFSHAAGLLDRLELHVVPVALGAGISLGFAPASLALEEATTVPLGVARLRWRVLRP